MPPCSDKGDSISVVFTRQDTQQAVLSREWDIKNSLPLLQLELNYTHLFLYSREVIKDIHNTQTLFKPEHTHTQTCARLGLQPNFMTDVHCGSGPGDKEVQPEYTNRVRSLALVLAWGT